MTPEGGRFAVTSGAPASGATVAATDASSGAATEVSDAGAVAAGATVGAMTDVEVLPSW
jgi:hypothetical protein